jgi:hypothetical protein
LSPLFACGEPDVLDLLVFKLLVYPVLDLGPLYHWLIVLGPYELVENFETADFAARKLAQFFDKPLRRRHCFIWNNAKLGEIGIDIPVHATTWYRSSDRRETGSLRPFQHLSPIRSEGLSLTLRAPSAQRSDRLGQRLSVTDGA